MAERYAGLVECQIHDALTRRQRGPNGSYQRRANGSPMLPRDVFVPPHLLGQLVRHELGLQLLLRRNVLQRFARTVQRFRIECGGGGGSSVGQQEGGCGSRGDEGRGSEGECGGRLETIVDAEVADGPQKPEQPIDEIRRKLSQDDSRRTTPERSWRGELDSRDESSYNIEGRLNFVDRMYSLEPFFFFLELVLIEIN